MSQENVEIVRRLYEAINDRDYVRAAELAHPEVEWVPDSRVGEGPIRGLENVRGFFSDRADAFGELRMETERFWEKDDHVLAFIRVAGKGRTSEAEFEIRIAHLWTLRDGVVVRGEGYGDRGQALAAAGLQE
jgi:ketosteroid isomerase-like protein